MVWILTLLLNTAGITPDQPITSIERPRAFQTQWECIQDGQSQATYDLRVNGYLVEFVVDDFTCVGVEVETVEDV